MLFRLFSYSSRNHQHEILLQKYRRVSRLRQVYFFTKACIFSSCSILQLTVSGTSVYSCPKVFNERHSCSTFVLSRYRSQYLGNSILFGSGGRWCAVVSCNGFRASRGSLRNMYMKNVIFRANQSLWYRTATMFSYAVIMATKAKYVVP